MRTINYSIGHPIDIMMTTTYQTEHPRVCDEDQDLRSSVQYLMTKPAAASSSRQPIRSDIQQL